jgi:HlyD family secretion protein
MEPGDYATRGRAAYTLATSDPKWVRGYVSEPDLDRVRLGARAWVTSDSFENRVYDGWVGFISPIAEFTPKTVETTDLRTQLVYEVRIHVKDPEDQLRLGMPTTVVVDEVLSPSTAPAPTTHPGLAAIGSQGRRP